MFLKSLPVKQFSRLDKCLHHPYARARSAVAYSANKFKVVFLGTPQVATIPLLGLLNAAGDPESQFEVVAVVTQPPRPKGRKKRLQPSPVHDAALAYGVSERCILTPVKAREESFLTHLKGLKPDLCVTAAYGNMLPQAFLDVPAMGTVNIHPSLLPKYRGAAPVNRCLENGDEITGVTLAYTELKCDSGPILASSEISLHGNEQAPEVLETLFKIGTELLLQKLPEVWNGDALHNARPQDESLMCMASKMTKSEGFLDTSLPAIVLHNKVRGFAGWPGTWIRIRIESDGKSTVSDLKVLETEISDSISDVSAIPTCEYPQGQIVLSKKGLYIPCGDERYLLATRVQAPAKKACTGEAFSNGMFGCDIFLASE